MTLRRLARAGAALVALALLVTAMRAVRTYLLVRRSFHAPRRPATDPATDDSARLGLRTATGVPLVAWAHRGSGHGAVVLVHGARADASALTPEARALDAAGLTTLRLDMPGCGESGGDATWGGDARLALVAAIDRLEADGAGPIGVYGFSMGSAVAAGVAGADPRVRAVALAGAFTDIRDEIAYEHRGWVPFGAWAALAASRAEGLAFDDLRPADAVGGIAPRPLLVVAGTRDEVVPLAMARQLFDRAREPKALVVVDGAAHGDYARAGGDAYLARLRSFFTAALISP